MSADNRRFVDHTVGGWRRWAARLVADRPTLEKRLPPGEQVMDPAQFTADMPCIRGWYRLRE